MEICFKCGKEMKPSMKDESVWEGPSGGLVLGGGHSFGSTLYDTLMDGVRVEILVCDECLKKYKDRLNEVQTGRKFGDA